MATKNQEKQSFVIVYDKGSENVLEYKTCTIDQLYKYIGKLQRKYSNVEWFFKSEY
ncbi:hypothetical protein [Bacteroides finegoldii]|uniref:hypothetical protein n=1 Tax=Bacteroides finegoldii TaxID=338188 RepID=UPI00189F8368|nr:hypothetical protein [Bacteroides finegoldii]